MSILITLLLMYDLIELFVVSKGTKNMDLYPIPLYMINVNMTNSTYKKSVSITKNIVNPFDANYV